MMDQIRVIGLPTQMKKEYSSLMKELLEIVKYEDSEESAVSWPSMIGITGGTFGIRLKVTYKFWEFFKMEGKKNLAAYNKKNGTSIRFLQEKGLKQKDRENLCLYIRNVIRNRYEERGIPPIVMQLRRDKLKLGDLGVYEAVVLVERLHIDLKEWKGLSIEKLTDERLLDERKNGRVVMGPLILPGLGSEIEETTTSTAVKRIHEQDQGNISKKSKG
ncbi:unnamed protein product [Nippostrongylus brasiliensis]|uniref:DUF4283 domain-containing protein n=1 Tax=Nippostrongylus brasiliensis TaxID=27835 RepID=A0A0N4YP64_NIPBR|nr:unnamed protein product [Nippostrongylus brasiliensis]